MHPALVAKFVAAFKKELARLAAEQKGLAEAQQRARIAADRKMNNLVEAIGDGRSSPAILAKLAALEGQRGALSHRRGSDTFPNAALHPNIAQTYAARVTELKAELAGGR